MTPERFRRIEALFHAACARSGAARAELLAQADPELRREVESLLARRADGAFLERPAIRDVAPPEPAASAALAAGAVLGPYRIEDKLGEGGMGEVFRAVDTRLGRAVAIKAARGQFGDRFEREARAISSLNHPNICTLFDVGPDYLVMELVEGETLSARLARGPLARDPALRIGVQILAALAEAHAKGVVHRDLKPGNIMLAKSGVKVLDFGLAKSAADATFTTSRALMGTPAYMAPEQRAGQPADARSDIYAFGCILYEMLTGAQCGPGRARLAPRRLERLVDRCLATDPARRWPSASELERELAAVTAAVNGAPRRLALAIAAGALVALALGVGGWQWFARRGRVLTDKDTVVLADFANTTGDPVFDGALRQGLAVQLEQSPFLSIVPDAQVQQALVLMGRKRDAKLTPDVARELCQRTGSAAVLEGSIAQVGAPYLLTLRAVACASGDTLASTEAQAADKSHVLDALGTTAARMRAQLGESLGSVRKFDAPLEQVTTPSLEALKAYSAGYERMGPGGPAASIPFFERAVELDPDFAAAYAWLGIEYTSLGESTVGAGYTRKAYELRDRASEREKYFIAAVYHKEVTGDIPQAIETCKLWMQAYPRATMPHSYLAGAVYPVIGEYQQGVDESRASIRLDPRDSNPYAFGMFNATALGRADVARSFDRQAVARRLHSGFYPLARYSIAFLDGDAGAMAQQVSAAKGLGVEDALLAREADTAAYFGRLASAREFSRRAVEAAGRGDETENIATYLAMSALREALFGNTADARRDATLASARAPGIDARYGAALAFARAGDTARAQAAVAALDAQYPQATLVQSNYLPTLRAEIAIAGGDPSGALATLRAAAPYELGATRYSAIHWTALYPAYVRGEASLAAGRGADAAAEFRKILDHRGIVVNEPIGALARLQLGRAYALQARAARGAGADYAKARAAYRDFLALWRSADADVPVLRQARAEYARLANTGK